MAVPTIPISAKENLGDPIDIRVDIIHPEPVAAVAFPAAAVVRTQAQHGEAIRGMHEQLLGVPIQEELTTLRFRAKTVNGEGKLQALVDGKKVLITKSTIRRDLKLEDAKGVDCLPNVVIFEHLTLMGDTLLFLTMMVQAQEDMGKGSANPTDPHHTPTIIQSFTSQPQKTKQHRKPRRKYTMLPQTSVPTSVADEAVNEEMDDSLERAATTAPSLDSEQDRGVNIPRSGEDSLKLTELMELCTKLQQRVLDLETTKTTQAMEIKSLKKRVKKLKRRKKSRTHGLKRLYKVGLSARVESSADKGLGEEDASKQERIANIDANKDIILVSTHDEQMFDANQDLGGEELFVAQQDEKVVEKAFKRVNTFVDYRTELVEESSKKAEEEVTEGSTKRAGTELEQKSAKKQKIDDDKDTVELQQLVKIIPDEEGVAIDAILLAVKPLSIVD
nr:hypothetical protein [Tanacetum cinerariifolium]